MIKSTLLVGMLLIPMLVVGKTDSLVLHQQKLKKLERDIVQLHQRLEQSKNKRSLLTHELSRIEKQIGQNSQRFTKVSEKQSKHQQQLSDVEHQLKRLQAQLDQQQNQLARHVQLRYQSSEYSPLKTLLYPEQAEHIQRYMHYHQSIIDSRKRLIEHIRQTQQSITHRLDERQHTLSSLEHNQNQLKRVQEKLVQQKKYQAQLIQALDDDIAQNAERLKSYHHDKVELARLIDTLSRQQYQSTTQPFSRMKSKLPPPLISKKIAATVEQKGLTFDAPEGSVVRAIYPGKVVFSDWLKGYGLLMIIDHGQGYMTLYAHNQSLYRKKGDKVSQGDQIATVGHSGGNQKNSLYFEIRHQGRALTPLGWLSLKNS